MIRAARKILLAAMVAFGVLALGCSGKKVDPGITGPRSLKFLSQEEAQARSRLIAHPAYQLWLSFDEDRPSYDGRETVSFELSPDLAGAGSRVFLDFQQGQISKLIVNGRTLPADQLKDPARYDGYRLSFPAAELSSGSNRIEIWFSRPYTASGMGLNRFRDPEDKGVYVYSRSEPYFANRVFPCFDQPDLKATFELTVEAPKAWQIISNTLERDTSERPDRKTWAFPPTPLLSTYLFAVVGGPFASWKAEARGIPVRFFARKALGKQVDVAEWLKMTRRGLAFYAKTLGVPYPFRKYDQILCPEFYVGAMENPGAVIYSDNNVLTARLGEDRRRKFEATLLHEMAHMWFGDLVTMKWWNGVWLKEAFATFLSAWAVQQRHPDSWQRFVLDGQDYLRETSTAAHPIDAPVPDTEHANLMFDGTTYNKGAAILRQLMFYVGQPQFMEGIQRYLRDFSFKNAELADLLGRLAEASGQRLDAWEKLWLRSPGVNTLQVDWACKDGKISKLDLIQGLSPGNEALRPHRTLLALYRKRGKRFSVAMEDLIPAAYDGPRTAVEGAAGRPCPDLIFANYEGYDFVKLELDSPTIEMLKTGLSAIEENFTRAILWQNLWNRVLEGKLRAQDFLTIAMLHAPHEKDVHVLNSILHWISATPADATTIQKILGGNLRPRYEVEIERFMLEHLLEAKGGSELQQVWMDAYLRAARSPDAIAWLKDIHAEKRKLPGFRPTQSQRWELLRALARMNAEGIKELIALELEKDPSASGRRLAAEAEVEIPTVENKRKWLKITLDFPFRLESPFKDDFERQRRAREVDDMMISFSEAGQDGVLRELSEDYFRGIVRLVQAGKEGYSRMLLRMLPSTCDQSVVRQIDAILSDGTTALPVATASRLREYRENEERCIRARAVAEGSP